MQRLVALGGVKGLPEKALTPVLWTVSNLARTGHVMQNHLKEAGALQWLVRVTQAMNGGGGLDGGVGGDDFSGDGVRAEVAAVLAAITNLANGNPANQSRLRQEEGLMEALTALEDDPEADGLSRKAAQKALAALGSVLDHAQAQTLAKLRTLVERHPPEVQVATWARVEGRMWIARKL